MNLFCTCRRGFGWIDKAQCFWSARRFGVVSFKPGLVWFFFFWGGGGGTGLLLPWPKKKMRRPRIMMSIGRCSIVWYRARSRTIGAQRTATEHDFRPALVIERIEQRSLYVMILGCLNFLARVVGFCLEIFSTFSKIGKVSWHTNM